MIIIIIFLALLLALAPFGAIAIGTLIIKKTHKCSYDSAVEFMLETAKDYLYRRNDTWLHCTDFPLLLKSDLKCLFTDEVNNQWEKVLALKSSISESAGIDDEKVAFYSFPIPWDEDKKDSYDKMITSLCRSCLVNMHCTLLDVVIDYLDWTIPEYKICRIRYARTAMEQDSLKKMLIKHDLDSIGGACIEVNDAELDIELNLFGDDENVSN